MKNVKIKNNIIFYLFVFFLSISCVRQTKTELKDKPIQDSTNLVSNHYPSLKKHEIGEIKIQNINEYSVYFDELGKMSLMDSLASKNSFKIYLHSSIINFEKDYKFIIARYTNFNKFSFVLEKINDDHYSFQIIQYTKKIIIDNIEFKKNKKNRFEIVEMKQIEPTGHNVFICPYPLLKGEIIDLSNNMAKDESDCYYTDY